MLFFFKFYRLPTEKKNAATHRFLSVNGKSSKKSMAHRGETTRFTMLFFEVLLFTDKKRHDIFWFV